MSDGEHTTRYRFGPRERGGTLAGWRTGQIVTVAVGLVFGVVVLRWEPNAAGVAAAMAILVLYGALATVPFGGRTSEEWVPVAVCWGARRAGPRGRGGRGMGALRGLRLLRADWQDMGVLHDRSARTLTAVLSLRGASFALLGPDEQDRRVGAWASVLASLAREGSPVHRVQWVAASFPDEGHGARAYLRAEGSAATLASAATASYESLLADMDSHTCAHDVVLALQVRLTKSVEAGCATLAREVGSVVRHLGDADVSVERILGVDDVAALLLRTYEARAEKTLPFADPWPMAVEERWSALRVDGMVHATFWVAEWPRVEVRSDFLAPLLLGTARSTFSVVMAPLGPDAAIRKVEASRTADLADAELRRRGGFVSTARRARESEVLARREAELAEGHASFRFAGFVTVSAATEEELDAACEVIQHSAGQSRLMLRRLYGDQASAYTCTLPLCRGLS
ncbi:MAG TPA: SCO6880 family protein [Acidimicrobiales bacterium]